MLSGSIFSLLCVLVTLISEATAKAEYNYAVSTFKEGEDPDYVPNSTYQTNLYGLLSTLTSNTEIDYGFYDAAYGQDPDTVYAIGLCRGDITPPTCRSCLKDSSSLLLKQCPHKKCAVGGYDKCMLHYANHSLSGYQESVFRVYFKSETRVKDWDQYSYVVRNLLSRLKVKAATRDSYMKSKFAAGNATDPSSQTVYAVVQCSPELTVAQCNDCLEGAFSEIPNCCSNRSGGVVIKFSCNFRYENFSFYEPVADALTLQLSPHGSAPLPSRSPSTTISNSSQSTHHENNNRSQLVIPTVVPTAVFVGLLIFICIYLRERKPTEHFESEVKIDEEIKQAESSQFDFGTIRVATNDFSDSNKLGQGGFGPVYKGTLFNGQEVAVKRLSSNSSQGDTEFKNELLLMAKLQHRNLVSLLGFCIEREERLLVYEFLPNKSLDNFLFDPIKRAGLDWKTRYKIIEGIARGLLYLHEDSQQKIIHRDLKLSNILLDADMNPKISDFGLARLFVVDQTQANASKIVGTIGYMAPEYGRHGKFSVKSDVFSFGVIMLEIVSGRKNGGFRNGENVEHLLSIAWKNWKKGTASNIIDPTLNDAFIDEIVRCLHIGLLCVQARVVDRPTLASVMLMLDSSSISLPVPLQPAYFMNDLSLSNIQFSGCNSAEIGSNEASANEASISSLYPR